MKITTAKTVRPMRDVVNLLESNANAERISDYPFRSAGEVSAYLTGLEKQMATAQLERVPVPLPMPKAPDWIEVSPVSIEMDALDILHRRADDAQNRLDILTSLEVSVNYNFRDQRSALLSEIEAVRKRVMKERNKFLKAMDVYFKFCPSQALAIMSDVCKSLRAAVDGYCTSVNEFSCVSPFYTMQGITGVRFCEYLEVKDMCSQRERDEGFTYPTYYIVISAVVTKNNRLRMFANTLHEFQLPGKANLGECFLDSATGVQIVNGLMEEDRLTCKASAPLNVPRSQIKVKRFSAKQHIQKVMLDPKANKLVMVLKPDVKLDHMNAVIEQLVRDTTSLLTPKQDQQLVYSLTKSLPKQIHFQLRPLARSPARKITDEQRRLLADKFGMSGDEIRAVQDILYRGAPR